MNHCMHLLQKSRLAQCMPWHLSMSIAWTAWTPDSKHACSCTHSRGIMGNTGAVAQVVHEALDKPINISYKGVTDLVTDTDKASEEAILGILKQQFPRHAFLGEEGGVSGNTSSEYLWAVDPLDGTTNFSHGYPSFGVSVAGMLPRPAPALSPMSLSL